MDNFIVVLVYGTWMIFILVYVFGLSGLAPNAEGDCKYRSLVNLCIFITYVQMRGRKRKFQYYKILIIDLLFVYRYDWYSEAIVHKGTLSITGVHQGINKQAVVTLSQAILGRDYAGISCS